MKANTPKQEVCDCQTCQDLGGYVRLIDVGGETRQINQVCDCAAGLRRMGIYRTQVGSFELTIMTC